MNFVNTFKLLPPVLALGIAAASGQSFAQALSPNGYSGLGLVPSANTLKGGTAVLAFDPTVPGAPITTGYNTQIGFGLMDNLELVGRLATNNQKCNMFQVALALQFIQRLFILHEVVFANRLAKAKQRCCGCGGNRLWWGGYLLQVLLRGGHQVV
jgi:hypothetical protein